MLDPKNLNVGLNIKKIRELKNLTQQHMANEFEVTQKTWSNIEAAGNDIKISTLVRICQVLNISITKLIEFNPHNFLRGDGSE
jgi:transcriptional regulator with XRE-family HTH domain